MNKLKISVPILVVVFVAVLVPVRASSEPYKSVIQQAQELTLAQDRKKATQVLVEALEKEKRDSKPYKTLKAALKSLGEMFYTEKAQKLFELGRSLAESDPAAATEKFQDALALEPGNLRIQIEITRNLLGRRDCKRALELSKGALMLNPFSAEFFLARLQAKACLNAIEDFEAEMANPFIDRMPIAQYLEVVQAQHLIDLEKYDSALEILERAKVRDLKFPEVYFWIAKTKQKKGTNAVPELQRYVALCKDNPAKVRVLYQSEPNTCREITSAEKMLESLVAEGT